MELKYKLTFGKHKGVDITSRSIPISYLTDLEETLLLRGVNTSSEIMRQLDKELKRRSQKKFKKILDSKLIAVVNSDHGESENQPVFESHKETPI